MLAASNQRPNPQPIIVVTSPENKGKRDRKEQEFLGYEWSDRKGAEGIHYLNTGKIIESSQDDEEAEDDTINQILGVDDICTPLFNPRDLSDEHKINVFIRSMFEGKDSFDIPEELEEHVKLYYLEDLISFSNVEFNKVIKTKPNTALPKIDTSFPTLQISKVAPYVKEKVPFSTIELQTYVSTENMNEGCNGVGRYEGIPKIDNVTAYQKGDILVSNIRPYLKKTWLADYEGGCSTDVLVFRNIQPNIILNQYLYQVLSSDLFFDYMNGSSRGVKMPRGDKKTILDFEIPQPPIEIQQKIIQECSAIDVKRTNYLRQIEDAKSSILMHFSNIKGEKMKVSSIFSLSSGKMLSKKNRVEGDIPVYGGNGVTGYHNESFVGTNTIVIGRVGEYCGSVHLTDAPAWITDNALYVKEYKIDVVPKFVLYALRKLNLNQYANRTGQPNVSQSSIAGVQIIIPSMEEQAQIVEKIEAQEAIISNSQKFLDSVSLLKQAILDKYLK